MGKRTEINGRSIFPISHFGIGGLYVFMSKLIFVNKKIILTFVKFQDLILMNVLFIVCAIWHTVYIRFS